MSFVMIRKPEFKKIGTVEANKYMSFNTFEGQRKISPQKVRLYAQLMSDGNFRPSDVSFAKVKGSNNWYLVNGQHTLSAILQTGKPIVLSIIYYLCETESDLWQLMATFDTHASRTQSQVINAARGLFQNKELHNVSLRLLTNVSTALFALQNSSVENTPNFNIRNQTKAEKIVLLDDYPEEVLACQRYEGNKSMGRVGVYTAIIATLRASSFDRKAYEFWDHVSSGVGLEKNDPRLFLSRWLLRPSATYRGNGETMKYDQFAYCVLSWNSWVKKEPRIIVKVRGLQKPPVPIWK